MAIVPANNIEKMIASFAPQLQELEQVFFDILDAVLLTTTGKRLDVLGALVGAGRSTSADDDEYRTTIRARILINKSSGTLPELLEIVALLLGPGIPLDFEQEFPAGYTIFALEPLAEGVGERVARLKLEATAGGVNGLLHFFVTAPTFAFDGHDGAKFDGGFHFATAL